MRRLVRRVTRRTDGAPADHGPRPVPKWLQVLASAVVLLALAAIVGIPPWFTARTEAARGEIDGLVEPARQAVRDQLEAMVRAVGATRGYLLTGDSRFLEQAREQHRVARKAAERSASLADRLGPEVAELQGRLSAAAERWRAYQDELLDGEQTAGEYLVRLPQQQALFEAAFREADLLDAALAAEAAERRTRVRQGARSLVHAVAILGGMAMLAALAVGWLARREHGFSLAAERARAEAERRAREERALKEILRELGASVSFREVVQRAAEGAVSLTRAFGAYVEKFDVPEPGSEVEIVAVAGQGAPFLGTRVPYPGSLSQELVESGEAPGVAEVAAVGERMAPYLLRSCPNCTALTVPLSSGGELLGALALLRRPEQGAFSAEEVDLARSLGGGVSAALGRVLLIEDIDRERRARNALLESTDEGILAVDPEGRVTLVNRAASRMLDRTPPELIGQPAHPLIHHHRPGGEVYPAEECPLAEVIRGGEGFWSESDVLWRKDGSGFPVRFSVRPIEENGTLTGAVIAFHDITERKRHEEERERLLRRGEEARAVAESAVQARDDLLSAVSHDLRSPLGTILLGAEYVEKRLPAGEGGEPAKRKIEVIHRAAESMDRMIQDLLDVARLEKGRLVVERVPTEVAAALDEACALLGPHAEGAGISISCRVAPGLPPVLADPARLQQILSNLIGNAVKFTPEGGAIALEASRAEGGVSFSVSDTGRGIAPDERPHLFDRHWQAGRGDRRGLGLGLTIVKGLVEAHEGTIEVESTPGRGSTFRFTIPAATH